MAETAAKLGANIAIAQAAIAIKLIVMTVCALVEIASILAMMSIVNAQLAKTDNARTFLLMTENVVVSEEFAKMESASLLNIVLGRGNVLTMKHWNL